ncbi:MAG: HNH endonuclease [Saprospiraceae bacterium]
MEKKTTKPTSKPTTVESFWNEKWVQVTFPEEIKSVRYQISNYGRIRAINKVTGKEKLLKGSHSKRGHHRLNIKMESGKGAGVYVHRIVAETFVEQPSEEHKYVIHLDHDKTNNKYTNLRWATQDEVNKHAKNSPLYDQAREKQREHYKLNEAKVKMIKRMLKRKKVKMKIIAKQFGISHTQLNRIKNGENWADVDPD